MLNLESEIRLLIAENINNIHFDIMDGHFVNNITFGCDLLKQIKAKFPEIIIDTHLMVTNPEKHIENFLNNGSDLITWHAELDINHQNLIELVKSKSKLSGLAINPSTTISSIKPNIVAQIDSALVMSVFPGKSGQTLILDCLDKIKEIKAINPKCQVYVDGGVNADNAQLVYEKGADAIVSGSYLFKNIKENSTKLIKKI